MQNYNKNVTLSGRKIGHQIPVQATAKSRRTFNIQGSRPSKAGRPSKPLRVEQQLIVTDDDDHVAYSIPSNRNKRNKSQNHSLSSSVRANRAAEQKH